MQQRPHVAVANAYAEHQRIHVAVGNSTAEAQAPEVMITVGMPTSEALPVQDEPPQRSWRRIVIAMVVVALVLGLAFVVYRQHLDNQALASRVESLSAQVTKQQASLEDRIAHALASENGANAWGDDMVESMGVVPSQTALSAQQDAGTDSGTDALSYMNGAFDEQLRLLSPQGIPLANMNKNDKAAITAMRNRPLSPCCSGRS